MTVRRTLLRLSVVALTTAACDDASPGVTAPAAETAAAASVELEIPAGAQRYLIRLRDAAGNRLTTRDALLAERSGVLVRQFHNILKGRAFVAFLPPERAADLASDPRVEYVDVDTLQGASSSRSLSGAGVWGLDRVDQRVGEGSLDDTYSYFSTGSGVHIYIVDSGVDSTHSEFSGRWGTSFTLPHYVDSLGYHQSCKPGQDAYPHGTLTAGMAAGSSTGIATAATIHSLRITCAVTAFPSDAVAAMEWINTYGSQPGVVNYSYAADSNGLKEAINDLFDAGFVVTKAAGNDTASAGSITSNNATGALVVGASTVHDERAPYSNYGSVIDLFAPGDSVWAPIPGGGYNDHARGTSFAAPMVAGVAALIRGEDNTLTPAEVMQIIVESATTGELDSGTLSGSPNRLLYSLHVWAESTGVSIVPEETTYTWAITNAIGGSGTFAYQWQYSEGGAYTTVGTSSSYMRYVEDGDPDFSLRWTVSSGGGSFSRTIQVQLCWNHESIPCDA